MQPVICSMALQGTTVLVATMVSQGKVCWGLPRLAKNIEWPPKHVRFYPVCSSAHSHWITAKKVSMDVKLGAGHLHTRRRRIIENIDLRKSQPKQNRMRNPTPYEMMTVDAHRNLFEVKWACVCVHFMGFRALHLTKWLITIRPIDLG